MRKRVRVKRRMKRRIKGKMKKRAVVFRDNNSLRLTFSNTMFSGEKSFSQKSLKNTTNTWTMNQLQDK